METQETPKTIFDMAKGAEAEDKVLKDIPDVMKDRKPEPLWRCGKCFRGIRTYDEIKAGKHIWCKRCGAVQVIPAWPHWWEIVILYFRTCKPWWKIWTGTIFCAAKLEEKDVRRF